MTERLRAGGRPDKISNADIAAICLEAGMQAVRKNRCVCMPVMCVCVHACNVCCLHCYAVWRICISMLCGQGEACVHLYVCLVVSCMDKHVCVCLMYG